MLSIYIKIKIITDECVKNNEVSSVSISIVGIYKKIVLLY